MHVVEGRDLELREVEAFAEHVHADDHAEERDRMALSAARLLV